jgi:hypothetical protein
MNARDEWTWLYPVALYLCVLALAVLCTWIVARNQAAPQPVIQPAATTGCTPQPLDAAAIQRRPYRGLV